MNRSVGLIPALTARTAGVLANAPTRGPASRPATGADQAPVSVVNELAKEVSASPQFQQIMQAMDVLSVEVERLSEGHRFVARLLSEKAERDRVAALPVRERKSEHVTPH